ncbi:MAG: metallophosphoesterase [Pseudomonadota bacterium]
MRYPVIYAIGDSHGRDDLLGDLHASIREHHRLLHAARPAEIVHLGDYIDGGAESVAVIDRLFAGCDGVSTTCLMGNHEAMLLDCLASDNRQAWYTWLSNGGEDTMAALGLTLRFGGYDPTALAEAQAPDGSPGCGHCRFGA